MELHDKTNNNNKYEHCDLTINYRYLLKYLSIYQLAAFTFSKRHLNCIVCIPVRQLVKEQSILSNLIGSNAVLIMYFSSSFLLLQVEKTSATKRSSRKRQISSTTSSNKDLSLVIPPVVLIRQTTSSLSNSAHLVLALTSFTLCLWKLS